MKRCFSGRFCHYIHPFFLLLLTLLHPLTTYCSFLCPCYRNPEQALFPLFLRSFSRYHCLLLVAGLSPKRLERLRCYFCLSLRKSRSFDAAFASRADSQHGVDRVPRIFGKKVCSVAPLELVRRSLDGSAEGWRSIVDLVRKRRDLFHMPGCLSFVWPHILRIGAAPEMKDLDWQSWWERLLIQVLYFTLRFCSWPLSLARPLLNISTA